MWGNSFQDPSLVQGCASSGQFVFRNIWELNIEAVVIYLQINHYVVFFLFLFCIALENIANFK